jgi:Carboxypeptidase regulatory-like domain
MKLMRPAALLLMILSMLVASRLRSQDIPATASLEGIVVKVGTTTPIAGVDVELSRVAGTAAAPLSPGAAEVFAAVFGGNAPGLVGGAAPNPGVAPEVKYAKSGADGKFKFTGLKEGKYRLVGIRVGGAYYPAEFGQRDIRGRGLYFPIAAGQAKTDVKLEMAATGAIAGRVLDEDGRPMGHVVVMGLTPEYRQGELRLYIERLVLTDASGDYRLYWLSPVVHYVAAVLEDPQRRTINLLPMGPPGRGGPRQRATSPAVTRRVLADGSVVEETYGVVYYPSVSEPRSARAIDVRPGETIQGMDISMAAGKAPARHIRGGVINGATGQPAPNARVLAIPRAWSPNTLVLVTTADANGAFDLPGAVPNSYLLAAAASTPNQFDPGLPPAVVAQLTAGVAPQVGYLPVDVGSTTLENIQIVTVGAINVSGRIVFEGKPLAADDPNIARINIGLSRDPDLIAMPDALLPLPPLPPGTPPQQRPGNGQVTANGTFTLNLSAGDYRVNVNGIPSDQYVKAIRMGAENILDNGFHATGPVDSPMEIVVASDGGTISGAVFDEKSLALPNATVALVPEVSDLRRRLDLYRSTTTDVQGNFQITPIPPGNYKLFAWDYAPTDAWQSSDFIRSYENSGQRVQVSPNEKTNGIKLTIIPIRK